MTPEQRQAARARCEAEIDRLEGECERLRAQVHNCHNCYMSAVLEGRD